ncbi:hypothetical protein HY213_01525 [Candidatus Peregrinibacteria bacterium]|nr:hypothetical protein [Candidatus Peregrinibacteria bacterium]
MYVTHSAAESFAFESKVLENLEKADNPVASLRAVAAALKQMSQETRLQLSTQLTPLDTLENVVAAVTSAYKIDRKRRVESLQARAEQEHDDEVKRLRDRIARLSQLKNAFLQRKWFGKLWHAHSLAEVLYQEYLRDAYHLQPFHPSYIPRTTLRKSPPDTIDELTKVLGGRLKRMTEPQQQ